MPYISTKSLETVNMLLQKNIECCGNLLLPEELKIYGITKESKDNELFLYMENTGLHECQNKTFTKYVWHTHPYSSKSYPSIQDLFIPLRKRPDTSIIFTRWGIWEIYAGKKYDLTKENIQHLKDKYIDNILSKIYFSTEKGKANTLVKDQLSKIIENLNKLMNQAGFKFVISFTDWREINNNYVLKFTK